MADIVILKGLCSNGAFETNFIMGDLLGKGGFGEVKRCTDKKTHDHFAVKIIPKKLIEDAEQLRSEVRILSLLDHYAVLVMKEVFESKAFIYLVTELLAGAELFDTIVARGSYSEKDASVAIRNILDGVAYLHDNGIVHRDLKPENLVYNKVGEDAVLKIVDFGLAAELKGKHLNDVCGSPGYIAPEVLFGTSYSIEADMWSLGVIAFILLSGLEPFAAENEEDMFKLIIACDYTFDPSFWANVSANAKDLVKRLLTKSQSNRMTAHEALEHSWVQGRAASTKHMPDTHQSIKTFNARRKLKGGVRSIIAINRMMHGIKRNSREF